MKISLLPLLCVGVFCCLQPTLSIAQVSSDSRFSADRTLRYSEQLLDRFDANEDGYLDENENSRMRSSLRKEDDLDGDKRWSLNELYFKYSNGQQLPGTANETLAEAGKPVEVKFELYRLEAMEEMPGSDAEWIDFLNTKASKLSIETTLVVAYESSIQIGQRKPRVIGQANGPRGNSRQVSNVDVGAIVKLKPYIKGGNLCVGLDLEYSDWESQAKGPDEEPLNLDPIETLQISQMVVTQSDRPSLVRAKQNGIYWIVKVSAQ